MAHEKRHREPAKKLRAGRFYFDDVVPGNWYEIPSITLRTEQIDRFAELSGDCFAIHMSDDAARELGFPRRVAHGLLVLSLTDGLKNRAETTFHAVASLGWNWSFGKPVFAGDTLSALICVMAKRETRKTGRGIIQLAFEVTNQDGTIVQSGFNELMVVRQTR